MSSLSGRVTVMGNPQQDAEILAVSGNKVLAVARTDRDGRYELPGEPAADRVVARFAEPFLGIVHRPVAGGGPTDLAIEAADIVRFGITIVPAEGSVFDWVDVKLTPQLPDLSPVIALAAGTTTSLHEVLWSRRVTDPKVAVRLLRGTWDLRARHFIDGPLRANPLPAFTAGRVELSSGGEAAEHLGGFLVDVTTDTQVRLQLRPLRPEEQ
jgi:hypothetical protein